jgi:hypothetical protein
MEFERILPLTSPQTEGGHGTSNTHNSRYCRGHAICLLSVRELKNINICTISSGDRKAKNPAESGRLEVGGLVRGN